MDKLEITYSPDYFSHVLQVVTGITAEIIFIGTRGECFKELSEYYET